MAREWINLKKLFLGSAVFFLLSGAAFLARAAELPLVRIAHGAFNEKIAALWVGVEQGFFRKHGVEVEVINIRTGPQTMAALASGDILLAYASPGGVLGAVAGGMDVVFLAGVVNHADGDFVVAPNIKRGEDLRGKRVGVQSIGGGIWTFAMLALEHLGLEPTRDNIQLMIVGDQGVLTQALAAGRIEGAPLGYTFSGLAQAKGFRVLLDLGKVQIPYQGLSLVTQRSYLKKNPQVVDAVLRGTLESVAFIHRPANREAVLRSLAKNLRLRSIQEAESGYKVLEWLYSLDIKPSVKGLETMHRLLVMNNPKMKGIRVGDVVDETAVQRVEKTDFYRDLVAQAKR
ncbi:MAG: ABC transporter substrate-binding protein [Deltaproteobacteria bacterium]|nr:ABC transporter substrate-binding protein [Deltaproteobacteria bacterium]